MAFTIKKRSKKVKKDRTETFTKITPYKMGKFQNKKDRRIRFRNKNG